MKPYAVAFVLLAIAAPAQETLPPQIRAEAARLDATMHSAEDYCREIDSFTSQNPPTALVSDGANSTWRRRESQSDSPLTSYALVWTQAHRIVAVKMWTPELGARFEPVSYCFRSNGTVARVSVAPRALRDRDQPKLRKTIAVGHQWFFDQSGRRIAIGINRQDPAPLRSETTEYIEPAVQVFKWVRDLPFAALIGESTGYEKARATLR